MTDLEDQRKTEVKVLDDPVKAKDMDRLGDELDEDDELAEIEATTWGEVIRTCCVHTPAEWLNVLFVVCQVCFFLYFFILGLEILGDGAQALTSCAAGGLFGDNLNPIAGLMIGILCTVCLQSSSTTTSIIVSLVGAGAIRVKDAIYMVMGANIGTSVTNTIVAMGQLGDGDQLERAFAGATVHDMFNFLSVAVLLPVEVITGYLRRITDLMVDGASTEDGESHEGFVKKIIEPLGKMLINVNKDVTKHVAKGGSCSDFYPVVCEDPDNPTKSTCEVGIIKCGGTDQWGKNECPALFDPKADRHNDEMAGLLAFFIGICILFICLAGLVWTLQRSLMTASTRIIHKATNINGYVAMIIGAGITVAVQSSSITTSTLTPLVGLGVLRLEQMFPLTLGANIGTTMTSIMSALVTEGTDALQVALAHLMFNVTGIIIWFPFPFMRAIPLALARKLGKATRHWKGFPILYIIVMFLIMPAIFFGISTLYTQKEAGATAAATILLFIVVGGIAKLIYWWKYQNGSEITIAKLTTRQKRLDAKETLAYDMFWIKRTIQQLYDHTGCPPAPSSKLRALGIGTNESALMDVHLHMPYALRNTEALIAHTNMPRGDDDPAPVTDDRFARKNTEFSKLPEVDFDAWTRHHLWVLFTYLVCAIGILVFIILMFIKDSVASTGAAAFVLALCFLFLVWRAYEFFFNDGATKSKAKYTEQKHKEAACETYAVDIARVKANLFTLAEHTDMVLDDDETNVDGLEDPQKKDVDDEDEIDA